MFATSDEAWLRDAFERLRESGDDIALRDEISARTDWLARRGARRFAYRGEPLDDLVQVGRIGLLKAIAAFEPDRGVPFSAYATAKITGELRRHFRDHTWSVHVPRSMKDLAAAVNQAGEQLHAELGRPPDLAEIAQRLGVADESVVEALEAGQARRAWSLESPHAVNVSESGNGDDPAIDREMVRSLLWTLAPRERTILFLRFFEGLSQSEIAERVGTSQVHVGRLIASSLRALADAAVVDDSVHDGVGVTQVEPRFDPARAGYRSPTSDGSIGVKEA